MTSAENQWPGLSGVVTHYETLRRAALGDTLPSEARTGLMLFLRQGMWGWARAIAPGSTQPPPTGLRPVGGQAPEEDRTVIYILAALAIPSSHRGVTP